MSRPNLRYVLFTLLGAAAAVGSAGAFTWTVDPYSVHGRERLEGFNEVKPYAYSHAPFAKRRLAADVHPRTLFLGNSRVDAGFDPRSSAIPRHARPAFNFGIPGQGLSGDYTNLVLTEGLDQVKRLVIGVDFLDFPFRDREPVPGIVAPQIPAALALTRMRRFAETTLSIDALIHSALTIRAQRNPFAGNMTPQGLNTFGEHRGFVRLEGHHAIFHQRNLENARIYLAKPKQIRSTTGRLSPAFSHLRWILDWCRERGIAADLVIYPYHAHILELFHLSGLWPLFEEWKRLLVDEVRAADTPAPAAPGYRVTLWDFSGYHVPATEEVPPPGDTATQMHWYWEAGHFKAALGDLILARVFGDASEPRIGVRLVRETLESTRERIRQGRAKWRAARHDEAEYLEALYARVARERK